MRRATTLVLNIIAATALTASWLVCIAIFAYGQFHGWRMIFDGQVGAGLVYTIVAVLVAGLAQTVIAAIGLPAMALAERLSPGTW